MTEPLSELPPTFVPDWFIDALEKELEKNGTEDPTFSFLVDSAQLTLNALVSYMKQHNFVFATRVEVEEADCPGSGGRPVQWNSDRTGICGVCGKRIALVRSRVTRSHKPLPKSELTPSLQEMLDDYAKGFLLADGKAWYDVPETLSAAERKEALKSRSGDFTRQIVDKNFKDILPPR